MILTTFPKKKLAHQYIQKVLRKKFVACGQVDGPVKSIYKWEGKVVAEKEWRVSLKTTAERVSEVYTETKRIHPYEIFQWVVVDTIVSDKYGQWIQESTR